MTETSNYNLKKIDGTDNWRAIFQDHNDSMDIIDSALNEKLSEDDLANPKHYSSIWSATTWTGLTSFFGEHVWTDGENIYYSDGLDQYVLDKSTSTWSTKNWTGLTSFDDNSIWTDGENIYYSYDTNQYVLDKSTSTWSTKTWSGLTTFGGSSIWTDGENIYYSNSSSQYVLDKATSAWSTKTWSGLTSFYGVYVWTDGENIYYSYDTNQYVLDKASSTWSTKTWSGLTSFYGVYVWTDRENIYYSSGSVQYILDKSTSTWSTKTWSGLTTIDGRYIWTDGENIYYSYDTNQYVLDKKVFDKTKTDDNDLTKYLRADGIWAEATGLPSGGASGTVLQKNSAADYDVTWASISTDNVIKVTTTINIPASGSSESYNVSGLTANHELIRWNFSSSAENWPPVNLTITTYDGYFTIQNTSGTTNESIKPMFAVPVNVTATKR